jgi:glycosyltransferase involved in cell wall biosynthesis
MVSILIPAYNADRWIGETLNSAITQTFPKKEIIVVDDGSTDRTLEITKKYECGNLKIIRQDNQGASSARNKALAFAQGDYIQWLDADDLLAPDKISRQIHEVEKGFGPRTLYSGSFGTFYTRPEKSDFIPNSLWKDLNSVDWLISKFRDNVWMSPAVWLVSRELTDQAGPWDERLSLDDDGEYFSRVVAVSENIRYVPEAKTYYRQWHTGSLSRRKSEKAIQSLFLSLTLCMQHLLSLEDSQRTRIACVQCLQNRSYYFYPEHLDLFNEMKNIALDLGFPLSNPKQKFKHALIEVLLGRYFGRKFISTVKNTNFYVTYHFDKLLSKINM